MEKRRLHDLQLRRQQQPPERLDTSSSEVDLEAAVDAPNLTESASQNLDIDAASNKLLGFTQTLTRSLGGAPVGSATSRVTYSVDANGAMTSDGLRTFEYDESRRLSKVKILKNGEAAAVDYLHNALGQRVFKSQPLAEQTLPDEERLERGFIDWLKDRFGWPFSRKNSHKSTLGLVFAYDEDANLIGEYDNGSAHGLGSTEYIWLPVEGANAIPVGIYTPLKQKSHSQRLLRLEAPCAERRGVRRRRGFKVTTDRDRRAHQLRNGTRRARKPC